MSEQLPESAPEVVEQQALPAPVVSPPSAVQPTSATPDADAIVSRLKEALLPELKDFVTRSSQSVKDRRFASLEQELEKHKQLLASHGGDVAKAARELKVDEILSREESPANQGKVGEDWEAGVQKILSEVEQSAGVKILPNDPELRAAVTRPDGTPKEFPSWAEAYAAISRVALRRARGIPAGIVPTEVSGLPATNANTDELANQLFALNRSGAPIEAIAAKKKELMDALTKR